MDAFIAQIVQQFGLSDAQAKQAVSVVLGLVKQFVDEGTANDFLGKLPGAADLLGADESAGTGGGGLLGKVAGGLLGGSGGGLGGLAGKIAGGLSAVDGFKEAGLDVGKIDDFVGAFAGFAKGEAGEDLTAQVIDQIRQKLL